MTKKMDDFKEEQRNLLLALLLILVALFAFDWVFPSQKSEVVSVPVTSPDPLPETVVQEAVMTDSSKEKNDPVSFELSEKDFSVPMENPLIRGSFDVSNGGINALSLSAYKETTAPDSPNVVLLNKDFYTQFSWMSSNAVMPVVGDQWKASTSDLTPETPLVLTFENQDIKIERTISMDDAYMITMTDRLTNLKETPVFVSLTGQIVRAIDHAKPLSTVHEGFTGVLNGRLEEEKYADVQDDGFFKETTGGWFGLTDKYWQTILILDQAQKVNVSFVHLKDNWFKASFETAGMQIEPRQTITQTTRTFAGAKDIDLINDYQEKLGIPRFDLSIDFGWFYFLTKPFLAFLNWLYGLLGNMGLAILVFATLIRIALLPIATKSYESMAKMRKFQPKMKALQERFKDDRQRLQIEMMNLYKREKVNPASGCLPLLIQIPIFFALYKVLSVSLDMRQAPFFGWIHDLSVPDPSSVFTLFGYMPWPIPSFLNLGVWPILMGVTMYVQQKLNPAPTDPSQAAVLKWMPVIFTFMLGNFAAGLVIYWTWSNILSIAQQKYIMKKVGVD